MIRTVLFDLDDTIFDFTRAEREAISHTLTAMNIPHSAADISRYHEINAECWRMLERGEITRDELLTHRFRVLFSELGVTADAATAGEIYEPQLGSIHYLIPHAREVLSCLSEKYTLLAVSNGIERIQMARLRETGILPLFRGVYISEAVGYNKPNEKFFDAPFAAHPNLKREESIIVGDSLTSDIAGGIAAGLHTCLFNPRGLEISGGIIPEFEIDSLDKLPALLSETNLNEEK